MSARKRASPRAPTPRSKPSASSSGYSGTPLWKKLGLKEEQSIAFVRAPANFGETLGPLPVGVSFAARGELDVALVFVQRRRELEADFARLAARLRPAGMLWVAWPKKASGVATDLTFDSVQTCGLAAGLVDVKVCAIDATWSCLKFVRRLADRPAQRAVAKKR